MLPPPFFHIKIHSSFRLHIFFILECCATVRRLIRRDAMAQRGIRIKMHGHSTSSAVHKVISFSVHKNNSVLNLMSVNAAGSLSQRRSDACFSRKRCIILTEIIIFFLRSCVPLKICPLRYVSKIMVGIDVEQSKCTL